LAPQPETEQSRHDAVPMFAPAEPEPTPVAPATVQEAVPQDDDKAAARRRSTVREKVNFGSSSPEPQPVAAPVVAAPEPTPAPVAAPAAPAPESQPRKAGWWSRAFGGGDN
jgi:ribonuclease E